MPPHEAFHLADAIGGPVKLTFADGTVRYALLKSAATDRTHDHDPWGGDVYSTRTSHITTTLTMDLIRDTEPAPRGFRAFLRGFFRVGAR